MNYWHTARHKHLDINSVGESETVPAGAITGQCFKTTRESDTTSPSKTLRHWNFWKNRSDCMLWQVLVSGCVSVTPCVGHSDMSMVLHSLPLTPAVKIESTFFLSQISSPKFAQGESNLRHWEEHTPRSQANTNRPGEANRIYLS